VDVPAEKFGFIAVRDRQRGAAIGIHHLASGEVLERRMAMT
jgi:hypothetical protein